MGGILRNQKYEKFAQMVAGGSTLTEAAKEIGVKNPYPIHMRPEVKARIRELQHHGEKRAMNAVQLTKQDILERIKEDWELARKLGQVSAALQAAKMLGAEMHKMFVERKEIGGAGDFDNKSETELRGYIMQTLQELGMDRELVMTQIAQIDDISDESQQDPTNPPGSSAIN